MSTSCNKKDLKNLLLFKKGVVDTEGALSPWKVEEDCCSWEGVYCNKLTKRIRRLDLPNYLGGELYLNILLI
ncbi:putative leucine-rich repeat-containing, plant-type [Medicago truncatula]|uniref:Putative leucine-rich repeat-containing, plant-type n=1 Tax=Medicago truncatula TaxID=3880 RepID=A0A396IRD0_MEDTR|nr:putative leucine-rich repeat-containing, plant-type [Medicago truncatula]